MSKKMKNKATPLNHKSALKIALPVIIGILGIAVISVIVAIATSPRKMPSISKGDDVYLKLDGYDITYEKLYGVTKYNYGISELVNKIDKELLKNQAITEDDKLETLKIAVFADVEYDDLTEEEREEKIAEFRETLVYNGIITDQQYDEYMDLQTKRYAYAKKAFPQWVKDNDFSAAQYLEAFNILKEDEYTHTSTALILVFASEAHAKEVLNRFDVDLDTASSSNGWYFKSVEEARKVDLDNKDAEYAIAKAELLLLQEANPQDEEAIEAKEAEIKNLEDERDELSKIIYLTRIEAELLFIDIYNYLYAYYQGGNVDNYYDADGNLLDAYKLLVEGTHYEIVDVEAETEDDDEGGTKVVREAYRHVKWIHDVEDINEYVKYKYTEAEASAIDASFKTQLFSSLKTPYELNVAGSYNYSLRSGTNYRFLTFLYEKFTPTAHTYDFELSPGETDDDDSTIVGPSEEIRKEVRDYLIEENFNNGYQSLMLVLLRIEHKLAIYDRFLDASYGASYKTLYETTLTLTDFPEYKMTKKGHKTVVCEYEIAGQKIKITADDLFEVLKDKYGPVSVISLMGSHVVLNDEKYNQIYIPKTDKVVDKAKLKELLGSFDYMNLYNGTLKSVKEFKYAFENNSFESYGFPKSYGWDNFLKDYLQMSSDEELAANLSINEMYKEFYPETYTYEQIVELITLQWNKYFSLSVTNVVISIDYNLDGAPDEFVVDKDENQENWTDEQMLLAKQLSALIYERAPLTGANNLDAQLTEIVNEYKEANFDDPIWGIFKMHGLVAKNEAKTTWSSTDSLQQEFLDEMVKMYLEIEKLGLLGETLDGPEVMDSIFPTVYGYHQVAIYGSTARKVLDEEDFSLAKLLEFLTAENYEVYQEEENEMTDEEKNIFTIYYVPAVGGLEQSAFTDYFFANYRDQQLAKGNWKFENGADYEKYKKVQAHILTEVEKAYKEALDQDVDATDDE